MLRCARGRSLLQMWLLCSLWLLRIVAVLLSLCLGVFVLPRLGRVEDPLLLGLLGPGVRRRVHLHRLQLVKLGLCWLRDRLKSLIVVLWEKSDVAHLERS